MRTDGRSKFQIVRIAEKGSTRVKQNSVFWADCRLRAAHGADFWCARFELADCRIVENVLADKEEIAGAESRCEKTRFLP